MKILVTGGAGYIGSHTVVELLQAGYEVVVYDNLSNSSSEALKRVMQITGRSVELVRADVCDREALDRVFQSHDFQAVIHFAGLKAVGESVENPLSYYQNNLTGSATLCQAMAAAEVKRLVFSSSATVYGDPQTLPICEDAPTGATNPYGRTKLFIEEMLRDLARSDPEWRMAILRYFNPIGAHASGLIGEDPRGIPNNLFPFMTQVAIGQRACLSVFGNDYATADGTGVRDYIHVVDLARGHLCALKRMEAKEGSLTINLGTGQGYSVLEMIRALSQASGRDIPYQVVSRRPGDIASCYADPGLALRELGWSAHKDLGDMCRDGWNWQCRNPSGYDFPAAARST
jgi:UDP-glucose 4-epimerase